MMLDMKRTFDEVVVAHADPGEGRRRSSPTRSTSRVSSSFAGTQEYMAMEKLGQLRAQADARRARWDLIVVDTPPSRSALDFLDAPEAARLVPRRPVHPAADRRRPRPAAGPTLQVVDAGHRRGDRRS